jgi:hypothetical protein
MNCQKGLLQAPQQRFCNYAILLWHTSRLINWQTTALCGYCEHEPSIECQRIRRLTKAVSSHHQGTGNSTLNPLLVSQSRCFRVCRAKLVIFPNLLVTRGLPIHSSLMAQGKNQSKLKIWDRKRERWAHTTNAHDSNGKVEISQTRTLLNRQPRKETKRQDEKKKQRETRPSQAKPTEIHAENTIHRPNAKGRERLT